ncbi:hypothetical protein MO973_39725 [Paenibacillus sp. TRM 82003]|nr:hypothetical protein [Paenibacillus sp. TRM 82003]
MRWFMTVALAICIGWMGGTPAVHAEGPGKEKHHHGPMMGASAHQAMYMQLLAEKYTPDSAAAWKTAMEERGALMLQLHELRKAQQWDKDAARDKMKRFAQASGGAMKAHQAVIGEFTDAVTKKDEAAIKAALPKLLQSEQNLNEALRKWLETEKQAKSS